MISSRARVSRWNVAWSGWVASFAVIETLALRSKNHKATLSYHTAKVFGFGQKTALSTISRRVLGTAMWLWFLFHVLRWKENNVNECGNKA